MICTTCNIFDNACGCQPPQRKERQCACTVQIQYYVRNTVWPYKSSPIELTTHFSIILRVRDTAQILGLQMYSVENPDKYKNSFQQLIQFLANEAAYTSICMYCMWFSLCTITVPAEDAPRTDVVALFASQKSSSVVKLLFL